MISLNRKQAVNTLFSAITIIYLPPLPILYLCLLYASVLTAASYLPTNIGAFPSHSQPANTSYAFPAASRMQKRPKIRPCKFCLKNGERPYVYNSHQVKDDNGVVTCPVLRKYVCAICGATGGSAHTRKYCPLNNDVEEVLLPIYRRLSNGLVTTSHNHK